jgi:hypothetical protein
MNSFTKVLLASLVTLSSYSHAGVWCVMDEIVKVDTSGNYINSCWVSGKMDIDGVQTHISDLSLCGNTNIDANNRNLSLALAAFTNNKKLAFYFTEYSACSEVLPRWEAKAGRVTIQN